eukprot:347579_1
MALSDDLSGRDGLTGRLTGQLDRTVSVIDGGHVEAVLCSVGPLVVRDRVLGALDSLGDAGRLIGALARTFPCLGVLLSPDVTGRLVEELGEVVGGA